MPHLGQNGAVPDLPWGPEDLWDPRNPENRDRVRSLRVELRQRVLHGWDPIGVSGVAEAEGEYDGYLGPLLRLLHEDSGERAIHDYLLSVLDRMGLRSAGDRESRFASDLHDWWRSRTA